MILFTKRNALLVLSGNKWQTRRFWLSPRCKVGAEHWAQLNLKPQSRFARLLILKVWVWDGTTISDEDVKAEGYDTIWKFLNHYYELNKGCLDTKRGHYAIEFKVIQEVHNPVLHSNTTEEIEMRFCGFCKQMTQHYQPSPFDDKFYVDGGWVDSNDTYFCAICS